MSRTPCKAVADHQGATDPRLKTPDLGNRGGIGVVITLRFSILGNIPVRFDVMFTDLSEMYSFLIDKQHFSTGAPTINKVVGFFFTIVLSGK